jgi:hypothetical protein
MEEKMVNAIDALFDEDNSDNITLYNEKDEAVEFEQIALIPLDERVFAILKPTMEIEGVADDEAFAFEIVSDEDEETLKLVEDDELTDRVFDEYDKLIAEQDASGKDAE